MFEKLQDWFDRYSTVIAWGCAIGLGIVALLYLLQHLIFANVTGTVTGFNYTQPYYTTDMIEQCTTVNKVKVCTQVPKQTYHPATYSIRIFADDKNWECPVNEYAYHEALRTKWATAYCFGWK